MRPIYEAESDRQAEERVRPIIEDAWNCRLLKMPKRYGLDWLAMRGAHPVAAVEFKRRNVTVDQYREIILSVGKFMDAHLIASTMGIPSFFVVGFACGSVKWVRLDGSLFPSGAGDVWAVKAGGRTDRGDAQDIEPVALIPVADMRDLSAPTDSA